MTESRDSVRRKPVESSSGARGPAGARRLARLVSAAPLRRLAVGRLVAVLVLIAATFGMFVAGGTKAVRSARDWLHGQPPYLLPFDQIELDPPPPPWIRSGAAGLLERVRGRSAGLPETIRVLDLKPAQLAQAFPLGSPWVKAVTRVERSRRNHLLVRLVYRVPVAFVRLGQRGMLYLDADGVVLPADDLDLAAAGPLVELVNLAPAGAQGVAAETRPGLALRLSSSAESDAEVSAERVRDAAQLAGFLHHHDVAKAPLQVRAVIAASVGYYLQTADPAFIYWGPAPGSEPAGAASSEQKWTWLREWLEQHRISEVAAPQILALDHNRWVIQKTRLNSP